MANVVLGAGVMTAPVADVRWSEAKQIIGDRRVTLGPQASQQWTDAPDHLAMTLSRYRAAAALIGEVGRILEIGCGEGIGAGILSKGREMYVGLDPDAEAIAVARAMYGRRPALTFDVRDITHEQSVSGYLDAAVALDVIEHVPPERETAFMRGIIGKLHAHAVGPVVIGTPSANAAHLASPQSRAGHVNLYTPTRLRALMARHFRVVQLFGMQDTALHFGHPEMAHYLLAVGIGPR